MDMFKQKISNHHFNEPKYAYGWPSTKVVSGNKVHTPVEYAERENVNPPTSHSFISWDTSWFATILGARDQGDHTRSKVLPSQTYILVGEINRLGRDYQILKN